MQNDHGMLMRAAAEHDINHVTLGHAVTLIEANMEPGVAQETISLIHAAISPGHAVLRANRAAQVETESAPEPVGEADEPKDSEIPVPDKAPRKTPARKATAAKTEPKPAPAKASRKTASKT